MVDLRKFASVKVQGADYPVMVQITSVDKPAVNNQVQNKWQTIIDVMAKCLEVPAGLIMRLDENEISVFISSRTDGNPYKYGDSETLRHGLYCETVAGSDIRLLVPDAREDNLWNRNPDIKLGMVSYLGLPVKWPDGEVFGTICVLDSKKNAYSDNYINLIEILKTGIEDDLGVLLSNYNGLLDAYRNLEINMENLAISKRRLERILAEKDILLSEIHHRVKNNLQIISSLVEIQINQYRNMELKNQLLAVKNRIQSMGAVHEVLYNSKDLHNVNLREYIIELVENLDKSLSGNDVYYDYDFFIDNRLSLNLETAVPIGLIVNEIVTNSIKHAFPGRKSGKIIINIHEQPDNYCYLEVLDNGCGIPVRMSEGNIRGLGQVLIDLLVQQMDGSIEISANSGTAYYITLKKSEKEEKRWAGES